MYFRKFCINLLLVFGLISCNSEVKNNLSSVISGKVIAVKDGDTIEILYAGKPLRIRLSHIDCPEIKKGQPYGKAAKQKTSDLCFGQEVKVLNEGVVDRYGRLIGVIINAYNQNVNKEVVREGLAWHYKQYSTDSSYALLENKARENKLGLWADENPVPPWEWREKREK